MCALLVTVLYKTAPTSAPRPLSTPKGRRDNTLITKINKQRVIALPWVLLLACRSHPLHGVV